ncbi:MAG: hypothetical protein WDW38_003473 [Sanguina aurantia]
MPWLRYFFPKDFDLREGEAVNPFYQFFDVGPADIREDLSIKPPSWCPNSYFRLSFTQVNVMQHTLVVREPFLILRDPDAIDMTRDDAVLLLEKNEAHLAEIMAFCRNVATFGARTWKDAFPLVDLLRGLLLFLLRHMVLGQKIAEAKAQRDLGPLVLKETEHLAGKYELALAEMREGQEASYDAKLLALGNKLRQEVGDELRNQLKLEREEKGTLLAKLAASESQSFALLQPCKVGFLHSPLALAATGGGKRSGSVGSGGARPSSATGEGGVGDLDSAAATDEVVVFGGGGSSKRASGAAAWGGAEVMGGGKGSKAGEGTQQQQRQQEDICPSLVFRYTHAGPSHQFMLKRILPYGKGVSWPVAETGELVSVTNVSNEEGVGYFRGEAGPSRNGSYLAIPLPGKRGEVLGMICLDTVPQIGPTRDGSTSVDGANRHMSLGSMSTVDKFPRLTEEDKQVATQLADQICRSIRTDQDALGVRMAAAAAADLAEPEAAAAIPAVDPESLR